MKVWIKILIAVGVVTVTISGVGLWRYYSLFPKASKEIVELSPEARERLVQLRDEAKFGPHNFPPLGYTGITDQVEKARAVAAVDTVIDKVLSLSKGPLPAKAVIKLIDIGMDKVDDLETEDRDRVQGYMLEIWYIIGFREATGVFAYGGYFVPPKGYGEPLPPGWTAPDKPRQIELTKF